MCLRTCPNPDSLTGSALHEGASIWAHGVLDARGAGRPVKPLGGGRAPADAAERPQPAGAFSVADTLLPGVLMAWDFCHSYRCACAWLRACSCSDVPDRH